jgi:hypothetical protein
MKHLLKTLLLLLLVNAAFSQAKELPVNPSTKLVSILDSIQVGDGYPIFWVKSMVDDWANYTVYNNDRVRNIFLYDTMERKADFGFESIYEDEKHPGRFFKYGGLRYLSKIHGRKNTADKTIGQVSFYLYFQVRGKYIIVELTKLHFSNDKNEMGAFEDPQLLSNDGVHYLTNDQRPWLRIKKEYYARLQVVAGNLKEYLVKHYKNYLKH